MRIIVLIKEAIIMKTCFFIGHRDAPESIHDRLLEAVERHISEYGVTDFVVGRYGNFDRLAARAVIEAKQHHSDITLTLLMPYYRTSAEPLPDGFDGSLFPDGLETVPKRAAILQANQYMIHHCDYLIAYVRHPGKARDFLAYALRQEEKGRMRVFQL